MARSLRGGVVSATTGCLRRGRGVTRGRRPTHHLAPPPSGEPETGGGTAGRVSRAHTREPARRPKRAAQVARAGSGARRRSKAQRPARVRSPRTPSERCQRRPCQHLSGGKKGPFQAKKITAPGSGAHPRTSGGLPGTSARLPLPNTSPSTAAPELSRGHLVDPRSGGGRVERGGRGGKTWQRQRAGRGRPPRIARASRYRTAVPPGPRAKTWLKKRNYPTLPPLRSGAHEGPRPGPGRPIRAAQYDSGRSPPPPPPRPGLAVDEGAGEGEKKSRPPTGTHVGPLKGRVRPPRPPARAGPGPSASPDPAGLGNIFARRHLPGDRSPRGTAPGPGPLSPGHPSRPSPVPTSGVRLGKASVRKNPTPGTHARPPTSPSRPPPA